MSSAKDKLLLLLLKNVGKIVSRDDLASAANVHDWQRVLRTLRNEGWEIESKKVGYLLHSKNKKTVKNIRRPINNKLRYEILQRDNSTCQRCGKTIKDGIKLEVDHKIPVEWGGENEPSNLWTLCNHCNGGKKHFFSDFAENTMKTLMKEKSGYMRLYKVFLMTPNEVIDPIKLEIISGIRDWTRTLRLIRKKEGVNITWVGKSEKHPYGGYKLIIKK
jgi:5-methylcytosine-specific restriction endonuclease McrA